MASSYYTEYKIFHEGKEVFLNTNSACYSSITGTDNWNKYIKTGTDGYIQIYFPKHDINIPHVMVLWWIKSLREMGLPIHMTIGKVDYLKEVKEDYYIWTLNFNDYTSNRILKVAIYFLRYIYEESSNDSRMSLNVEEAMELHLTYPQYDPIYCFLFSNLITFTSGHRMYIQNTAPIQNNIFLELLEKLGKEKYNCYEIDNLKEMFRIVSKETVDLVKKSKIVIKRDNFLEYAQLTNPETKVEVKESSTQPIKLAVPVINKELEPVIVPKVKRVYNRRAKPIVLDKKKFINLF